MISNIIRCFHNRRLFQAVTGMDYTEFTPPEKKPRGCTLLTEAETRNREKARRQGWVGYTLSGVKCFRSFTEVLRNSLKRFINCLMRVADGIWNLYIRWLPKY